MRKLLSRVTRERYLVALAAVSTVMAPAQVYIGLADSLGRFAR
jgi:hypothetical protein